MGISDSIAGYILQTIKDCGGSVELRRGELAERFGCVPSQINYVLSTRFAPEHGFVVESRRGGGGCIRIRQVSLDRSGLIDFAIASVGQYIDLLSAAAIISNLLSAGAISPDAASTALAAIGETALKAAPPDCRPYIRAGILNQILISSIE